MRQFPKSTTWWAATALLVTGCIDAAAPPASTDDDGGDDLLAEGARGVVQVTAADGTSFQATYTDVGGRMIWQDDIDLGPVPRGHGKTLATADLGARWPGARVDYIVDPSASDYEAAIDAAAKTYSTMTPLTFHKGIEFDRPYITYVEQSGVSHSAVGMSEYDYISGHTVYLDNGFSEPELTHTIIHETGHAMGLYHEQERNDRNEVVDYDASCVESGETGNFTEGPANTETFGEDYDRDSVMEYASWSLCDDTGTPPVPAPSYATRKHCVCYPLWKHGYSKTDPAGMIGDAPTFSVDDINTLWHMYEPTLGSNEAGDQYGATEAAGDFDGDGYMDLAIGAPGEAPGSQPASGVVYLYKGTRSGLVAWGWIDPSSFDYDGKGDKFGAALTAGDLDGDGYTDLAVGAPGKGSNNSGIVYVWHGGPSGLHILRLIDQAGIGLSDDAGDAFGSSLAIGDFDHDGHNELAIGIPGEKGSVGGASGYVCTVTWNNEWYAFRRTNLVSPKSMAGGINVDGQKFGTVLAVGDFNQDGIADLAVGSPENSMGSGAVYVFTGGAGGLTPVSVARALTPGFDDRFGSALAVGDFDGATSGAGHRVAQLAIGAPRNDVPNTDAGRVYVFKPHFLSGSFTGFVESSAWGQGAISGGTNDANDHFGAVLAAGDLDGDGNDDLVVGVPDKDVWGYFLTDVDGGAIVVLMGSSSGLSGTGGALIKSPTPAPGSAFGSSVSVADFTRNGKTDFTIGASNDADSWNAGAMYFFTGRQGQTIPQYYSRYDQASGTFQ